MRPDCRTKLLILSALGVFWLADPCGVWAQPRVMIGVNFDGDTSIVMDVVPGGPAERAGIQKNDEIMSVGDDIVLQPNDLLIVLAGREPGEMVRLEIKRGEEIRFFDVELVRATLPGEPVQYAQATGEPSNDADLGIVGKRAPELSVDEWINLPEGVEALTLEELRGKTVCLLFFQSNCVSSRRQAIPIFRRIVRQFEDDERFVFIAVQTAFEAFDVNTAETAKSIIERARLDIPLAQDGSQQRSSRMAESYNTGGTPWTVIIDPEGNVQFDGFNIMTTEAVEMMKKLADGE